MRKRQDTTQQVPTFILGGTGYVAGELLRLVSAHPYLNLSAILSDSQPGEIVSSVFTHLFPSLKDMTFSNLESFKFKINAIPQALVLSAAPHGVSAALIDDILATAESVDTQIHIVDISADFRYGSAAAYEAVYKHPHGAPDRIREFTCAVPEHYMAAPATAHMAHPGCFATAILLATVPFMQQNSIEPQWFVAGITGSTGSGRAPTSGTHHPQRHSDFYAYNALVHRHAPEVTALASAASGVTADYRFVPHSGPFARGIHVTAQARLQHSLSTQDAFDVLTEAYSGCPFVHVGASMPHIKDVVASNYAHLSVISDGETISVMCAIDNLVKGAAGGALQWANRLLGFEETAGLSAPAPGWT